MQKLLIFSGTTEGRELTEILLAAGICCEVCVATEYGKAVMEPRDNLRIHPGRMDAAAMQEMMRGGDFLAVVDATHPYALTVSQNIRESAERVNLPYLRLKRDTGAGQEMSGLLRDVTYVKDTAACIKYLRETTGNILLTTGSKELAHYAAEEELKARLYVRVLPGIESLSICNEQGIPGKQIIAMQGPFSVELNEALLKQYDISVLVTKECGHTGGFAEKIEAAKRAGAAVVVIENPDVTEGDSRENIMLKLSELFGVPLEEIWNPGTPSEGTRKAAKPLSTAVFGTKDREHGVQISLTGLGMGDTALLTGEAKAAIEEADYLFGAKRLLQAIPREMNQAAVRKAAYLAKEIIPYIEEIEKQQPKAKIALLFSGDTGFFSGAEGMRQALLTAIAEGRIRGDIRTCPGISAVSYLAAKTGKSWQDARIVSIHGRAANLTEIIRTEAKVFLLVSGVADLQRMGQELLERDMKQVRITAGYQLSYPKEEILQMTPQQCMERKDEGLYACIIENPDAKKRKLAPGNKDDSFLRDKVPMTKEEVREVSLCKLGLTKDSVLYDVGSGTGSIAVEAAGLSDSIQVYAIEKKELALSLIERNCKKFGVRNVRIMAGEAPGCLADLPAPTHAFIGGSSGNLKEILECLYRKNPGMRVVINAISLETMAEITGLLKVFPICGEEILQMQVSRAKAAGNYHLMQAENPIYIVSFWFRQEM